MRRYKGNLILNVTGLAIGLTSFLLISLYVYHELSYDRFHENYRNIYRIKVLIQLERSSVDQALTSGLMSRALLTEYPDVEHAVRIYHTRPMVVKYDDVRFIEEKVLFADSSFFNVLDFKLLRGDPKTVLVNPNSIVITQDYARKYFGTEDPLGRKLILQSDSNLCTVTGVVQNIPSNSHLKFDILGSLNTLKYLDAGNAWLNHNVYTYIVLKDGKGKENFESGLTGIVTKYVGPKIKEVLGITLEEFQKSGNNFEYRLEPIKDIHMKGAPQDRLEPEGSMMNVIIFSLIALLILVIAIINYVNLATAMSAGRAKEAGVRKVCGSDKTGLIFRFIGESMIIVAAATLIAMVLVPVLLPYFNHISGKNVSMELLSGYRGILIVSAMILFTGTAAGAYPAFILASYNPVEVLKGTLNPGSVSKTLRSILVVFQFTVSIVIIIGAIVIYSQLHYMTAYDIGIDKSNLIIVNRSDVLGRQIETFRQQLLEIPGVKSSGYSTAFPGKGFYHTAVIPGGDPSETTCWINQGIVSYDYAETMGIKLAEGRFFSREYGTDTMSVILNQSAVKLLNFKDPLGKYILHPNNRDQYDKLKIIGIMKDFNIESLHSGIKPVCLTFMPGNYAGYLCIRLNGINMKEAISSVEKLWAQYSGSQPFQYSFFEDEYNSLYESEIKSGRIFIIFAILAIFIACLGLIGLITYMTDIRRREVGVRKTFGATGSTIVSLFSGEVIMLILIASLIAYPLAWAAIRVWLSAGSRLSIWL
jgi:putative ABC transport system permease protein